MSATVKPRYGKMLEKLSRSRLMLPKDGKTILGYFFWNLINKIIIAFHFRGKITVEGQHHIPAGGPFILIANHSARWDGPLVQHILNRRANYMVSPNEMKGLQGAAVLSVGAFPAHPRLNPVGFALQQLEAGEPVVVFPEGNVFYDGVIHPFKTGVAKIALHARKNHFEIPIVPVYIEYQQQNKSYSAKVVIGTPIRVHDLPAHEGNVKHAQRAISEELFDSVVALRDGASPQQKDIAVEEEPVELRCSA
ncbi:MAG: lysophospholipid acyltransferase family protein [Candidatus Melainabacteria bacterium]|nr:lysophospholipid acyltransferase family protein [Candidatus Melainabacteria bacterium]